MLESVEPLDMNEVELEVKDEDPDVSD